MLKIQVKSGDSEQILYMAEAPTLVLVQFSVSILRHRDLRNPDSRYVLREVLRGLKAKVEKGPVDSDNFDRYSLQMHISQIEDVLKQFEEERCLKEETVQPVADNGPEQESHE